MGSQIMSHSRFLISIYETQIYLTFIKKSAQILNVLPDESLRSEHIFVNQEIDHHQNLIIPSLPVPVANSPGGKPQS